MGGLPPPVRSVTSEKCPSPCLEKSQQTSYQKEQTMKTKTIKNVTAIITAIKTSPKGIMLTEDVCSTTGLSAAQVYGTAGAWASDEEGKTPALWTIESIQGWKALKLTGEGKTWTAPAPYVRATKAAPAAIEDIRAMLAAM